MVTINGEWSSKLIWLDGKKLSALKSQKVFNHSPDGFSWGYSGSGPAQLALAILLEYLSLNDATTFYQQFKFDIISKIPQSDFSMKINLLEKISNYKKKEERKCKK